jgi:hypothetical protein
MKLKLIIIEKKVIMHVHEHVFSIKFALIRYDCDTDHSQTFYKILRS